MKKIQLGVSVLALIFLSIAQAGGSSHQTNKRLLLASGPVMRPSSSNSPITNPSTGPRTSIPKTTFQPLPQSQPTELQQATLPTKPLVQQEKSVLKEKAARQRKERERNAMKTMESGTSESQASDSQTTK
jgi:hypothetical protein